MSARHDHHYHAITGLWRDGRLERLTGIAGAIEHDHDVETGNFGGRHFHSRYALPDGSLAMLAVWTHEIPKPKAP